MPDIIHTYLPVTTATRRYCPAGVSLADYVSRSGSDAGPVVCAVNDRPVLRADWPGLVIRDEDCVVVINLPQGPNAGGSDPARVVATLGLMALAAAAPGFGMFVGTWFANGAGAWLLSTGIMMGGTMLINAVMPVAEDTQSGGSAASPGAASTTYSLHSPTNVSKIGSVIPVQYGRMPTTPPLIAAPWAEYNGNQEYVHLLLCLGQGRYDVESLRFDTVDFDAVADVDYAIVEPGQVVPYEDNIFTSPHASGSEIQRMNSYETPTAYQMTITSRTNGLDRVEANRDDGLGFVVGDIVSFAGATYRTSVYEIVEIEVFPSYSVIWVKNPDHPQSSDWDFPGRILQVNTIKYTEFWPQRSDNKWWAGEAYTCTFWIDISLPSGLYSVKTDGTLSQAEIELKVYRKEVLADGTYGAAELIPGDESTITISRAQQTPVRVSYEVSFDSPGTKDWVIGIGRLPGDVSSRVFNIAYWSGLRFKHPKQGVYPGMTTIAVRAKASEGLSSDALSKIRVKATRKLPVFVGGPGTPLWTEPVATRSIAWAAADACRNAGYSIGMADDAIDLSALLDLDAIWTARGDYCDGVFDTKSTFWAALKSILKTGRAQPHMVGGQITFTRDRAQVAARAVFGPRNIVRNSFSIEYLHYDPDTPDDVEMEYYSGDTWEWETITCALDGSSGDTPATVRRWGITGALQAQREGLYEAACNRYRRVFVTFQTEMDARIVLRGQLVSVSHPLPSWGVSGEILGVTGQKLTLSEPVVFGTGDHYLSFRHRDGSQDGPYLVTAGADESQVTMADAVPVHVTSDINAGRTMFQFGEGANFERRCLVISARPRPGGKVELLCVVENDAVHTADGTGGTP